MSVSTSTSFMLSSTFGVLLFAAMQIYRNSLASNEYMTIVGGFLGHILFVLLLTAVSNFETLMFGKNFQSQLIPEVTGCIVAAMFACGLVHRVCVTTCFIFSVIALYYINKISQSTYGAAAASAAAALPATKTKKKN